ncbi:MAG: hypothetical protein SWO11_22735 [Thermodesulfobacteriota bacterium]|nr:hypothetical protein [Thermodesulfobacteriota bacterium]
MKLDLKDLPDQEQPLLDLGGLPDQETVEEFTPEERKRPSGAGGSFGKSLDLRLIEHPNLYGVYGASRAIAEEATKVSWLKYIYPEERDKFNKLATQKQTRQLLFDTLEAVTMGLGGRIISGGGKIAGHYLKEWLPSTYKILTTPIGQKALKPMKKAVDEGAKVMDMIGRRRGDIDVGLLRSNIFINQFERKLSKPELEAIPFLRERMKDPNLLTKIGRDDLANIVKNPSPKVVEATEKIGKYYDESFEFLKNNWDDVSFMEDYVTHIWNIPKARKTDVVNYFATKNPFLKQRAIPTLEEGLKLGLEPKTTNIAELLRIYDNYKIKTVFNHNFAKELKGAVSESGEPLMLRYDKAPREWVTIEHPALDKAMMVEKIGEKGIVLEKAAVKVHPDIAKEVKIIFDKPFSHPAIHAMEVTNAFTKKGMLTMSLFHHHALTESALSTGIGKKALSLWNPVKIKRALKNKDYAIFAEQELAEDAIKNGQVVFGALEDVQRNVVRKALMTAETKTKGIPGINLMTKGARKANDLWDQALWDYYHNTLKLWAYEKNKVDALKMGEKFAQKKYGRSLNKNEIASIKKEMGLFVNDSFGGQSWELNKVFGNPKIRQMLHWGLLAPDWTLSTLKQAAAPAKGLYKQATAGRSRDVAEYTAKKITGKALTKQGAKFWAKAGLYFNSVAQSVNYYNTKKEYGTGRFTWENAPGNSLNIFIGRNKDGTERYLRMGKQFREVMEWGIDPVYKLGGKMAPVARELSRQITAHNPGGGFPTEWANKDFWESLPERGKSVLEMPIPFSLRPYIESRPGTFMFTFPTKRGLTNYRAIKLFKKAIKEENGEQIRRVYISALENNLHAEDLFKSAKASFKADITINDNTIARQIWLETKDMDEKAKTDAYQLYRKRGILTPRVALRLDNIINDKMEVEKQRLMFGINTGEK